VLQSNCEANGIPTFAPDLGLPYLDAVVDGGGSYSTRLLVPEDRLEDARTLVPDSKRNRIPLVEPEAEELELLARRVRTCAMLLVTAPLGVWFGLEYKRLLRSAARLPASHAGTMRAWWFSIAVSVCAPFAWLLAKLNPGLWHGLGP
jgi:hypothetical protein